MNSIQVIYMQHNYTILKKVLLCMHAFSAMKDTGKLITWGAEGCLAKIIEESAFLHFVDILKNITGVDQCYWQGGALIPMGIYCYKQNIKGGGINYNDITDLKKNPLDISFLAQKYYSQIDPAIVSDAYSLDALLDVLILNSYRRSGYKQPKDFYNSSVYAFCRNTPKSDAPIKVRFLDIRYGMLATMIDDLMYLNEYNCPFV